MNKIVEQYIEKRKGEIAKQEHNEKMKFLLDIGLAEKAFFTGSINDNRDDYPFYDPMNVRYYKIVLKDGIEEITDEEYEELKKHSPSKFNDTAANTKMSAWYNFAVAMIVAGAIGLAISFFIGFTNNNWSVFFITFGAYLSELALYGILQLLAEIKQDVDYMITNKKK